jgi:hypothetical protein
MKNCDEMFFCRTEKSGSQKLFGFRTENGKRLVFPKMIIFAKFIKAPFSLATFWLRSHNVAIM